MAKQTLGDGAADVKLVDGSRLGARSSSRFYQVWTGRTLTNARVVARCSTAAVKNGKPLGVSVGVTPANKRTAACIDRAARKLHFPSSAKLDVVHQKF